MNFQFSLHRHDLWGCCQAKWHTVALLHEHAWLSKFRVPLLYMFCINSFVHVFLWLWIKIKLSGPIFVIKTVFTKTLYFIHFLWHSCMYDFDMETSILEYLIFKFEFRRGSQQMCFLFFIFLSLFQSVTCMGRNIVQILNCNAICIILVHILFFFNLYW